MGAPTRTAQQNETSDQGEGTAENEGPPEGNPDLRVQVEKGVPEASKRKQKRSRTKDSED